MSEVEAETWCQKLEVQALTKHVPPVESPCWDLDVPITYVICTKDQATPLELQNMMINRVKRDNWTVERCESDHTPFLSQPDTFFNIIEKSAGAAKVSDV